MASIREQEKAKLLALIAAKKSLASAPLTIEQVIPEIKVNGHNPVISGVHFTGHNLFDNREPSDASRSIFYKKGTPEDSEGEGFGLGFLAPSAEEKVISEIERIRRVELNDKQKEAVRLYLDKKIETLCLIGAAGTGKTLTLKAIAAELVASGLAQEYNEDHKHLPAGIYNVVFCAFTNRAVRNIAKVMPEEFKKNCLTIHKLLEYAPVFDQFYDDEGNLKNRRRFMPSRTSGNPLINLSYIIIEESSMVGTDLYDKLHDAFCPHGVKLLFLGDLNQLPPVYSSAILGFKIADALAEGDKKDESVAVVELTQVYRQALDNPILAMAHKILRGEAKEYSYEKIIDGKANVGNNLTIMPFKTKNQDPEILCPRIARNFCEWIGTPGYDPEEDCILIPFNKKFGTIEFNKYIAQRLGEIRGERTYEVIAGFNKHYFAVGDRVMLGSYEGKITKINHNGNYRGTLPKSASLLLTRFGTYRKPTEEEIAKYPDLSKMTEVLDMDSEADTKGGLSSMNHAQIDAMLNAAQDEERKHAASHILYIQLADTGNEVQISDAKDINALLFAYALTVHKAQGAEWRRVFIILHDSHSVMFSRELLYTAVTRAREELVIICGQDALERSINKQMIRGNSLAEKAEIFKGKARERQKEDLFSGDNGE